VPGPCLRPLPEVSWCPARHPCLLRQPRGRRSKGGSRDLLGCSDDGCAGGPGSAGRGDGRGTRRGRTGGAGMPRASLLAQGDGCSWGAGPVHCVVTPRRRVPAGQRAALPLREAPAVRAEHPDARGRHVEHAARLPEADRSPRCHPRRPHHPAPLCRGRPRHGRRGWQRGPAGAGNAAQAGSAAASPAPRARTVALCPRLAAARAGAGGGTGRGSCCCPIPAAASPAGRLHPGDGTAAAALGPRAGQGASPGGARPACAAGPAGSLGAGLPLPPGFFVSL